MRVLTLLAILTVTLPAATALTVSESRVRAGEPLSAIHRANISHNCDAIQRTNKVEWNTTHTLSTYDTANTTCQGVVFSTETQERTVRIQNYEARLTERVDERPSADTAVSTAEALRAKSLLNQSTSEQRLRLKQIRDNDYKCWPAGECKLSETVRILDHLDHAGFDRDDRIYADALTWVESQQNNFENNDWNILIYPDFSQDERCPEGTTPTASGDKCELEGSQQVDPVEVNENATCRATLGGSEIYEETSNEGPLETTFTYNANEVLNVTCNRDFTVEITNFFDDTQYITSEEVDEEASYLLPGGCWPRDDTDRVCSVSTTARALTLDGLRSDNRDAGRDWVDASIQRSRITGQRLQDDETTLTHVLLYEGTGLDQLKEWLLFRQNNDGSFGDQDRVSTTLRAVNAIDEDSEWIADAQDWARQQRPESLTEATMLYERYGQADVPLFNPSFLDVNRDGGESTISTDLSDAATALPLSLRRVITTSLSSDAITASVSDQGAPRTTGYLNISSETNTYRLPTIVDVQPRLSINHKPRYYHTAPTGQIMPSIDKSTDEMNCSITYSDRYKSRQATLTGQDQIPVSYQNASQGTLDVSMNASCDTPRGPVTTTDSFQSTYYPAPPFTTTLSTTNITDTATLTVTNQIPENITVRLRHVDEALYYRVPSTISIPENHRAVISLYQDTRVPEPQAEANPITISSLGYNTTTQVTYQLDNTTAGVDERYYVESTESNLSVYAALIILIGALSGAAWIYRRSNEDNEDDTERTALAEVEAYLGEELGETPEEVEEELEEEGFSDETVSQAEGFLEQINEELDEAIESEDNV